MATFPLALLSEAIGWRDSFLIIFFFMLLFTSVAWLTLEDKQDKPTASGRDISRELKTVFTKKELLKIVPSHLLLFAFFISFLSLWVSPFLMNVYEMSKEVASLFFMFGVIGFMVSLPIAGLISDRIGKRKPVLLAGHVLFLVFWLVMSIFGGLLDIFQLIGLLFFFGFAFGFVGINMTIPVKLFPREISGSAIPGYNVFGFIGAGFFHFFTGFILDSAYGGTQIFPSCQIIFVICTIGVLISMLFAILFKEPPLSYGNKHSRSRATTSAPQQQRMRSMKTMRNGNSG